MGGIVHAIFRLRPPLRILGATANIREGCMAQATVPSGSETGVRTPWRITVHNIEACNCRPGCNCQFSGFPDNGNCEALIGGEVKEGTYGDVSLAGVRYIIA